MKWSFILPKKLKVSGTLFVLMVIITFAALSIRQATQEMDKTLMSLYQDRLQPAVALVYLNENLYAKRLMLETYLAGQPTLSAPALQAQLDRFTADSHRRINQFEKTKLTEKEGQQLRIFKANLTTYAGLERSVLQLNESGQPEMATRLFKERGLNLFQQDVKVLHQLAFIQSRTGQEVVEAAHREAAGVSLDYTLLIAVVIIIGLLIQWFINNAKIMDSQPQPFHLN